MSIYGKPFGEKVTLESVESISVEEALELQSQIIESLLNINESDDEDVIDIQEGANIDYREAFNKAKKEYKAQAKECKKSIKSKDYSKAKSCTKKMKSAIDDCEKVIKSVDSSTGSAIFGYFAGGLLEFAEMLFPLGLLGAGTTSSALAFKSLMSDNLGKAAILGKIGGTAIGAGYVVAFVQSISIIVKTIQVFINDLKEGENTKNSLNLYRNTLLRYIKDMKKNIDKLNEIIDRKEKADKQK